MLIQIPFCLKQEGGQPCWVFEDDEGRKHGPHSLLDLYTWFHYGYIRDSIMVSLVTQESSLLLLVHLIHITFQQNSLLNMVFTLQQYK